MKSNTPVTATVAPKQPPPETIQETKTRRWIILSLWAIIAIFGLPAWYATTAVPRAELPIEVMTRWSEGQGSKIEFPITVAIDSSAVSSIDTSVLVQKIQIDLDQRQESSLHGLHVVPAMRDLTSAHTLAESFIYTHSSTHERFQPQLVIELRETAESASESPVAKLQPFNPVLEIHYSQASVSNDADLHSLAQFVINELQETYAEERATITHLIASDAAFARSLDTQAQESMSSELKQRSNRAFKYATTYHLTVSLFSGSDTPSSWDIKSALDEYLSPFLQSFASISTFTLDTQVQLYASLSTSLQGPNYDESSKQWTLLHSDLSAFINAAEWPLNPSIGTGPTMNFVVYVPSKAQSPLVISETGGTSWLIPQWGGVQIVNQDEASNSTTLTKDALEPVMRTFADQLDALLGLPQSPSSLPLRLSSLTRERTTSLIISASSTLGALARLSLKLTSIAIPDNVATSVADAIQHLEQACEDLRQGRFDSALEHARSAETQAEQAFFDPSMVGQVYFPDEHKVAVYVPMLGPMAVPLVMAAMKEVKRIRQTRSFSR
ncbi:hypothetical protein AAFC00_006380 [Neodothiora populina]|uniref:GPI transamidase component PIG-S n=1 Tax=Neodothiora populina TaxID=2781224 RepID=A0ABR3P501_9PEZI